MKKLLSLLVAVAVVSSAVAAVSLAVEEDAPSFTIKEVMKKCMKGELCKTVAGGGATDAEKKELLEMFTALSQNKPPKGDADNWKVMTDALVSAAQSAVDGKADAGAALRKAANCKACHAAHKGEN